MSYHKTTVIRGYTIREKNPFSRKALGRALTGDEVNLCLEWMDKHYVSKVRRGHWSADACIRLAEKMGLYNASFSYHTGDMSGKGRGSGDGEWKIVDGQAVKVGEYQDVDDSQGVHDLCDEIDA